MARDSTARPANAMPPTRRPSEPRDRLLRTASELFYREGIHAIGVDRIVSEAGITRATFYRHYPAKEDLVTAYLDREDTLFRDALSDALGADSSPEELLETVIATIADDVARNHTRGCPFINAAAEYPDATGPVRQLIGRHREWFRATVESALDNAGRDTPTERARTVVLLRDGALVGGYLDGPSDVGPAFQRAARAAAGLV